MISLFHVAPPLVGGVADDAFSLFSICHFNATHKGWRYIVLNRAQSARCVGQVIHLP